MENRNLSRREVLRLSALALTGAALAACGGTPEPTATPKVIEKQVTQIVEKQVTQVVEKQVTQVVEKIVQVTPTPQPKAPVVIKFQSSWQVASPVDSLTPGVKMFNDKNGPAITVNLINLATNPEDMLTAMAGGSANDVYHNYNFDSTALFARGVIQPIDDLISAAKDFDPSIYVKEEWDGSTYKGKRMAMPCTEGIPYGAFCWNKTLYAASGADPNQVPGSWEDIIAIAKKLNKYDAAGNLTQMGLDPLDANGGELHVWSRIADTTFINEDQTKFTLDNDRFAKVLDIVSTLYKDAGVPKVDAFKQQWDYWTGGAKSGFGNGTRVMIINGGWQPGELLKTLKDKSWQVAYDFTPSLTPGKKAITFGGTHQLMIPKICKIPNEAFKFETFMTSLEFTKMEFQMRGIACWSKYFAQIDTSSVPGLDWFLKSITVPGVDVWGPLRNQHPLGGEPQSLWSRAEQEVTYGTKTVSQALKDINTQLQKDLDAFYAAQKK